MVLKLPKYLQGLPQLFPTKVSKIQIREKAHITIFLDQYVRNVHKNQKNKKTRKKQKISQK